MGLYPPKPTQQFEPCPPGLQLAVCCDVIDLGMVKEQYQGQQERIVPKIRLVWQSEKAMRDGKPYLVQKRYTFSVHEKSNLRKDASSWRGKAFTDDEIAGFDFERLIGVNAMINVVQSVRKGSTYSDVVAIMRVPKGTRLLTVRDYTRQKDRDKQQGSQTPATRTEAARPANFAPDTRVGAPAPRDPAPDEHEFEEDPFGGALGGPDTPTEPDDDTPF